MTSIQINAIKQQGMLAELTQHRNRSLWQARQLLEDAQNADNSFWDKMDAARPLIEQAQEIQHEIDALVELTPSGFLIKIVEEKKP